MGVMSAITSLDGRQAWGGLFMTPNTGTAGSLRGYEEDRLGKYIRTDGNFFLTVTIHSKENGLNYNVAVSTPQLL